MAVPILQGLKSGVGAISCTVCYLHPFPLALESSSLLQPSGLRGPNVPGPELAARRLLQAEHLLHPCRSLSLLPTTSVTGGPALPCVCTEITTAQPLLPPNSAQPGSQTSSCAPQSHGGAIRSQWTHGMDGSAASNTQPHGSGSVTAHSWESTQRVPGSWPGNGNH